MVTSPTDIRKLKKREGGKSWVGIWRKYLKNEETSLQLGWKPQWHAKLWPTKSQRYYFKSPKLPGVPQNGEEDISFKCGQPGWVIEGEPLKSEVLKPLATNDLRTEECPCLSILTFTVLTRTLTPTNMFPFGQFEKNREGAGSWKTSSKSCWMRYFDNW